MTLKTLEQACVPRQSVFDPSVRDTVWNIDDLHGLNPQQFFAENYVTDGMRQLLTEAFRRMEGNRRTPPERSCCRSRWVAARRTT